MLLCWMLLCQMSLSQVSFHWMSWRPSLNSQLEDKVFYSVVMMDNQIIIFTFVTNIYTGKNHTIHIVILVPRTHPLQNIIVFSPLSETMMFVIRLYWNQWCMKKVAMHFYVWWRKREREVATGETERENEWEVECLRGGK